MAAILSRSQCDKSVWGWGWGWGELTDVLVKSQLLGQMKCDTKSCLCTDGLVQNCSMSIANALDILRSCTKPSTIYRFVERLMTLSTSDRASYRKMPRSGGFDGLNYRIVLKLDRHLRSSGVTETPVKFKSDRSIVNSNVAASRCLYNFGCSRDKKNRQNDIFMSGKG